MKAYRGGEQVVTCDGCFEVIHSYNPRYHNILVNKKRGFHAHSVKCAKLAKAKPTSETICTTEGCELRVATSEMVCLNKHPQ